MYRRSHYEPKKPDDTHEDLTMRTEHKIPVVLVICWFVGLVTTSWSPHSGAHGEGAQGAIAAKPAAGAAEPANPRAVAEIFSHAIETGDSNTVNALLLPGVLIYESGGAETSAAEYAVHHLPGDIAFMADVRREQLSQESGGDSANAWVATRSRLSGRFKGKEVNLDSTETLVLTKTESAWRIAHVHWSSAPHRSPKP